MNTAAETDRPWVVAAARDALGHLAPLIEARRRRQPVVVLPDAVEAVLSSPAAILPDNAAALLVVGPRRRSPRRMLPGMFIRGSHGRSMPVGWLPDAGARLAVYANAAVRVLDRPAEACSLAVLGQWEDRFLRVSLRTARWFKKARASIPVFHWTADRLAREDMIAGLKAGLGAAIYFGHGRPRGWAGYHGIRAHHFDTPWPEPIGVLLAVCCENASRWRTGTSFAEDLALRGVFGGALAAAAKTRHDHNRIWGPALCEAMSSGHARTLAELVTSADVPPRLKQTGPFRFIGDPLTPLADAKGAVAQARSVFAPAPDEPLPAWEETAWRDQKPPISLAAS